MEPGSVAENEAEFDSSRRLFLRCGRRQEHLNKESPDVGMDEFWEDQWWPSSLKDRANLNVQSCDSPLTSDSFSSLSTRDSSFFSWSEGSYSAAKHTLHSPEPLSGRFLGFSLFNPGVNHSECACIESFSSEVPAKRDAKQDEYGLHKADLLRRLVEPEQSECDGIVGDSRPEFERDVYTKSRGVKDCLDGGWGSDTSDSISRASVSSEESRGRDSCNEADDAHLARLHSQRRHNALTGLSHAHDDGVCNVHPLKEIIWNGGNVLKCDSCILDKNDGKCACACSINVCAPSSAMVVENSHVAALHQPSKASYLPECHGVYGLQGGRDGSARADRIARLPRSLHEHLLSIRNTAGVDREPFLHRKASYSAAVNKTCVSSTMHGYLRFAEQGGSPCYSFFLDDSDEVLFARASRQGRKSNKEDCEWTYSFHSKKDIAKARGAWKSWPKKENMMSDIVANMRVSGLRQSKAKSDQDGRAKEARFVLYDGGGQQVETPRAGSSTKMRGQPLKPVLDNTSTPQAGQIKEGTKLCISNSEAKACVSKLSARCPNVSVNESIRSEAGKEELKPNHSQRAELAAIIISTCMKEKRLSKKKETLGTPKDPTGWGIKFLEKGTPSGWGLSFMERSTSNQRGPGEIASCRDPADRHGPPDCCMGDISKGAACGSPQVRPNDDKDTLSSSSCPDLNHKLEKKMNTRKNRLKVDMTVILPAGDHGLPDISEDEDGAVPGPHGPTPLLERWASGGDCECGGWDMGCGLSVFKAETLTLCRRTPNITLTRNDRMNWLSPGNPFKLLTQGYRRKKVMVLEIIEAGLFSLSFQARVSPLQAFAIAVALFHQQMTSN